MNLPKNITQRMSMNDCIVNLLYSLETRSTCTRSKVAAVITDLPVTRIFSIGYNGGAKKTETTCHGDKPGGCGCVHAEMNALAAYDAHNYTGDKAMYVSLYPCTICAKLIVNMGFKHVFYLREYRAMEESIDIFNKAGIMTTKLG